MLRCHRRHEQLTRVLEELSRFHQSLARIRIHVLADRPTEAVHQVLEKHRDLIHTTWFPDFPILSIRGERFREAKREQFRQIKEWSMTPDWVLFQDDDRWFEPLRITTELPEVLNSDIADMWYACSFFVWDRSDQVNVNRIHRSPVLFRFRSCDEFPLTRDIQAPVPLHDEAIIKNRAGTLATPLLDYGTFSEEERSRVFDAFWKARKRDSYVYSIKEDPKLASMDEIFEGQPWKDLWRK